MDLKKLQLGFKTGGLLALTPPSITSFKPTILQRCYIILVFFLYTAAALWSKIQKKKLYARYNYIQFFLHLMVDSNLYINNWYPLVLLLTTKRRQWFKLVKGLRRIDGFATNNTNNLTFVIALVIFWMASVLTSAVWLYFLGWNFYRIYIVEYLQVYSAFFYMALACTVLNMMLERYKFQSSLLREQIKCGRKKTSKDVVELFKQIKFNVFMLKQAVDAFNEIFGWIILLNIFYGCTRSLVFLYDLVKGEDQWSEYSVGARIALNLSRHSSIFVYCVRYLMLQDFSLNLSVVDRHLLDNFALRHRFERIRSLGRSISTT
jgi:hypothetical protein